MAMSSLLIGTDVTFNIKTKDQIISRFQNTILTILSKKEVHTKKKLSQRVDVFCRRDGFNSPFATQNANYFVF